ncbi:MAG: phosphoribosyltransferase family protein [Vicingaceae bacterium]|nr:phosphoribosyltransferase family protein [Vicingaceae bacterium]
MINDFFNLIFPKLCSSCEQTLLSSENVICTKCLLTLPKTGYHLDKDNPINKIFWGRVDVTMAAAFYSFTKGGKVQRLLHRLKYRGGEEVGEILGLHYGFELKTSEHFKGIDYIIPVPLHKNKLKKRGYNQSESFARGLSKSMKVPINITDLYRKIDSNTQTKKTRYKRWENVGDIFGVIESHDLGNKTILLVDDVVTTGATIEATAQVLVKLNCKVLVAAIACA